MNHASIRKNLASPEFTHQDGFGWYAVDLDGTLAKYDGWQGQDYIGEPIPAMMAKVKKLLADGCTVKIFTARAGIEGAVKVVHQWLADHGLPPFEVTDKKDFNMIELWDDRARQVVENKGTIVGQDA